MLLVLRSFAPIGLLLSAMTVLADDEPLVGGHARPAEKKQAKNDDDAKLKGKKRARAAEKGDSKTADTKSTDPKRGEKPDKGKQAKKKSPEADREEVALLFVGEHQPELLELLERLKGTKEKDYQQAIRELSRDSQRINSFKEKDPKRFEQEVRAWQLDSRIRLLTAKLSLEDRPELQEDLKAALAERADLRLAQRKLERERVAARLAKLDEEIAGLVSQRDEILRKTFDRLVRAAERARPKPKADDKNDK